MMRDGSGISLPIRPGRIAAAVDALVVVEDRVGDRAVAVERADERRAVLRVAADHGPVLVGQDLGVQDPVGQRELADVVQQAGGMDDFLLVLVGSRAPWPAPSRSARPRRRGARSSGRAGRASRRASTSTPSCSDARWIERASSCSARSSERSSATVRCWKISSTRIAAEEHRQAEVRVGDREDRRERAAPRAGRAAAG